MRVYFFRYRHYVWKYNYAFNSIAIMSWEGMIQIAKKSKERTNDFPKKKPSKNSEETLKKQTVCTSTMQ